MPDATTFWDRAARKYAASPMSNVNGYRLTMERTRACLSKDDHVLEIGCGSGSTALLLAPEVAHFTASDISAEMISICREKAAAQNAGNVEFVRATPHDAFDGAPFDAVLAFNILHLVEDVPATLRRLAELLKPGGLLISKTAALRSKRLLFGPLIFAMQMLGKAPPVEFFTPRQLQTMIADAGFEIVETSFHGDARPFIVARRK